MARYKAVVFDLDGTLLDTLTDIFNSVNVTITKYGYQARTRQEIRAYLGNGSERLCRLSLPKAVREDEFQKIFQSFLTYYQDHCQIATRPYDGITALLETLSQRGYKLAIVTNKPDGAAKELRRSFFPLVDVALGQNSSMRKKPAPDMVEKALEELGVEKAEAVYVGDSEVDKATADNSGLDCVLVTWGFRDQDVVEKMGAAHVIHRPEELLEVI